MSTNRAYASYQEIIDLHTESDKVSAIGIHTPVGLTPSRMMGGFFDQFKKYKYAGCSVQLVPAARLPVDPLQVSYDNPNDAIDPRDILNPILFHGCHGQDMGPILNQLYNAQAGAGSFPEFQQTDSIDMMNWTDPDWGDTSLLENLYYKALTDNTWKKAHPQMGFVKRGLRPLVYKVTANHQIMPSTDTELLDIPNIENLGTEEINTGGTTQAFTVSISPANSGLQFFANKLTSLGWLETRQVLQSTTATTTGTALEANAALAQVLNQTSKIAELPRIYMGVILLPPAYQVEQHYRMIINHTFLFAGFRGISFGGGNVPLTESSPSDFTDFQRGE